MSLPSAVFLDTSILAGQNYNFGSTALSTFVPAAKRASVELLLPLPTEQEILGQIRERSEDALKALEEARRRAPFLAKWKHYPASPSSVSVNYDVARIANEEWRAFLANFDVKTLDYSGVDVAKIMKWYGAGIPPFGPKKRKEFPDAFAIAILDDYARKNHCNVAVVPDDNDFRLACERFSTLFYFKSLPALTELLLMDDSRIEQLRQSIIAHAGALTERLIDDVNEYNFRHDNPEFEIGKSSLIAATITDLRIVALGSGEATITFSAGLESEHSVEYAGYGVSDWILETSEINCTAKIEIDIKSNAVTKIISIDNEFSWVTLYREPPGWDLL
jgi:hypothetical protein